MFRFIKKMLIAAMMFDSCGVLISSNSLNFLSMRNQECKIRPAMVDINSSEPLVYPYNFLVNECSGSCNHIDNPYDKLRVPDVFKNMNIKVFNLMSRTNEMRYVSWHETYAYKCRLDASVCNDRRRWDNDKVRCKCKELF